MSEPILMDQVSEADCGSLWIFGLGGYLGGCTLISAIEIASGYVSMSIVLEYARQSWLISDHASPIEKRCEPRKQRHIKI